MSKKRNLVDMAGRVMWQRKPQTQVVPNKKRYDRKKEKQKLSRMSKVCDSFCFCF